MLGGKKKQTITTEIDEEGEIEQTVSSASADAPLTEAIGAKVSASSKGEYWITVNHTVTIPAGASKDDVAHAQRLFVVGHRRMLEQAFLKAEQS